jgi:hypothetical protein
MLHGLRAPGFDLGMAGSAQIHGLLDEQTANVAAMRPVTLCACAFGERLMHNRLLGAAGVGVAGSAKDPRPLH